MSNNNMENQMSYISEMTEEEKIIFLRVLVALARSDNNFDDEEKAFIKDIAIIFGITKDKIDDILLPLTDDEVIKDASKIKKRQAALQLIKEACLLANSDGDLSDREIILIGKIGQAMGIELEKIEQISKWVIDRIVWLEEGKLIFEQL
ncbi:MAG: TerB family tellurite resistance protein [Alphaproteobacteria bacterium]|nr:TerB family tellurite resistance protein [Alphaproteobacteria bacterium]